MAYIHLAVVLCTLAVFVAAHPGFSVPPALANLTSEQKSALEAIFKDTTKTKAQIKAAVQTWVNTQSPEIQAAYSQISSKINDFKAKAGEWQENSQLSAEAKTLASNVQAAMQDENLTIQQTCENINTLVQAASASVLAEFNGKLKVRDCTSELNNLVDKIVSGNAGPQKA